MSSILITGCTGFIGNFLIKYFLNQGYEVIGTTRDKNKTKNEKGLKVIFCDFDDRKYLKEIILKNKCKKIFHLAGQRVTSKDYIYKSNISNTKLLLDTVVSIKKDIRIILFGSAAEYGSTDIGVSIREDFPLFPVSSYGFYKMEEDLMGKDYYHKKGLDVCRLRMFNVIGPNRSKDFFYSRIANDLIKIKKGLLPPVLTVNSLDSFRDYIDIKDLIRAVGDVIEKGQSGEAYNICSGKAISTRVILELMLELAELKVETKQIMSSPDNIPFSQGSYEKLNQLTNWKPIIQIEKSLRNVLDFWSKADEL